MGKSLDRITIEESAVLSAILTTTQDVRPATARLSSILSRDRSIAAGCGAFCCLEVGRHGAD